MNADMTGREPTRRQPETIEEIRHLEWNCPCDSCGGGAEDSWRWKGEYTVNADGTRTLWIIDAEDDDRRYHIDLPPDVVLAQRVTEGQGP